MDHIQTQHQNQHAFSQPPLSPTDFFNGLELSPTTAAVGGAVNTNPGPRSYKSRKYRPCDFCRARVTLFLLHRCVLFLSLFLKIGDAVFGNYLRCLLSCC